MSETIKSVFKCPICGEKFDLETIEVEDEGMNRLLKRLQVVCDKCVAKRDADEKEEARKQRADNVHRLAYSAGYMPYNAKGCTFGNSSPEVEAMNPDAWKSARQETKTNLWVCGPPGIGKSWLAYSILNRELRRGYPVMAMTGPTLNTLGFSFPKDREKKLNTCNKAQVLLIDDIDKAPWNAQGIALLWEVLDSRQRGNRRVIVTANQGPGGFREALHRAENNTHELAIFERLQPCKRLEMVGNSLRRTTGP